MVLDHEPIDDAIIESPMESEAPTADCCSFTVEIPVVEDDSHLDFLTAGDGELVDDVVDSDLFHNHLLGGDCSGTSFNHSDSWQSSPHTHGAI